VIKPVGVRREDKNEWEKRTPITPIDMADLINKENLSFVVQPSDIRIFKDEEFRKAGARVDENLSDCSLVFAVKEIPIKLLEPEKIYVFFSHTIKGQAYNMDLLRRLIELKCSLIDYERILKSSGKRLIFFGRHAGLAGMIDSLNCYGKRLASEGLKDNIFTEIKQSYQYESLSHAKDAMKKVAREMSEKGIPEGAGPLVVGFAGYGNVSLGAQEIIDLLPTESIAPERLADFVSTGKYDKKKIYKVVFKEQDIAKQLDPKKAFELQEYFNHPDRYEADFERYLSNLTILMNCIYWDTPYPRFVTKKAIANLYQNNEVKLKVIGDITCDINGSIEFTSKATSPDNPSYVYEPETDMTIDGVEGRGPVVMAVDNLPCELSKEASETFSKALKPFICATAEADYSAPFADLKIPEELKRGMVLYKGEFTPDYYYMKEYLT